MDRNKGIVFGIFAGIALCVLFYYAFPIYPESYGLMGPIILTPLLLAAVAIFGIAKVAEYLKLKATVSEDKGIEPDELRERLTAVEQRLTEVQDVMIAVSEKIDHMDGTGSKS
ncbi:MAG: hypothetical protein F4Z85_10955 [Gemmatimonadetes bacterium]|nr:hypothetical protein [Gemmatimonadota bacterium]MYB70111.1 hypothetical protein [Gemmatimonadota bacterium]